MKLEFNGKITALEHTYNVRFGEIFGIEISDHKDLIEFSLKQIPKGKMNELDFWKPVKVKIEITQ